MTNFLFHGDNQLASRQALHQAIAKQQAPLIKAEQGRGVPEIIRLDGKTITETDLRQALESQSLFGQAKLVIIDKLPTKLIATLAPYQADTPVFIWHNQALTPSQLKKLSNFTPHYSKFPRLYSISWTASSPVTLKLLSPPLRQLWRPSQWNRSFICSTAVSASSSKPRIHPPNLN